MRVQLRAFVAAAGACAVVFALLMSVVGRPGLARANGMAGVNCHVMSGPADASQPGGNQSGRVHCPDCCLTTHAASAVLPERLSSLTRPMRVVTAPVSYSDFSSPEPKTVVLSAVNGARAPPALLPLI